MMPTAAAPAHSRLLGSGTPRTREYAHSSEPASRNRPAISTNGGSVSTATRIAGAVEPQTIQTAARLSTSGTAPGRRDAAATLLRQCGEELLDAVDDELNRDRRDEDAHDASNRVDAGRAQHLGERL